jgi:hypothetical protein
VTVPSFRPVRRAVAVAAAVVAVAVLSGCDAAVTTRIEVDSATATQITAEVQFTGEVADHIVNHPETETELLKVFTSRAGGKQPTRTGDRTHLTYRLPVSFAQLKDSADVAGVANASLAGTDDHSTLTLRLQKPVALLAAFQHQTADQPDGAALAETMARSTMVQVQAVFPGGVSGTTAPDTAAGTVTVHGNTATIAQSAAEFVDGTYTVTGDPTLSWPGKLRRTVLSWPGLLVGVIFVGVAVLMLRRRGYLRLPASR